MYASSGCSASAPSVVCSGSATSGEAGGDGACGTVPCGDAVGRVVCVSPGNSVSTKRAAVTRARVVRSDRSTCGLVDFWRGPGRCTKLIAGTVCWAAT
eukprot:4958877-Pleurochrysis_carterae.AAC.2